MEINSNSPYNNSLLLHSLMAEVALAVVVIMKSVLKAHKILIKINAPTAMFIMSLVLSESTMSEGKQRSAE